MYSPISPSITSWVPENTRSATISEPQPNVGPWSVKRSHSTQPKPSRPAKAITSPSPVASRSGSTEKFTQALSHSRSRRRSVYPLAPACRGSCRTSIELMRCVTCRISPST